MNSRQLARLVFPEFRFGKTPLDQGLALVKAGVGGFCFYGGSTDEVREAARALRDASATPLLIAADYEDGVGRWVKGGTELPTNMAIGASGSEALARRKAGITAQEARSIGVDWIFAPVLDLAVRPENPIVNIRSFGADPVLVSRLAGAYLDGLSGNGALSSLKHFPGHGATETDSHLSMPEVTLGREALWDADLRPYRDLLRRADSVMVGHLKVPAFDKNAPASLSYPAITGLLRGELGYKGLVLTDALNMKALSGQGEPGLLAFLAGADILLFPEDPFGLLAALEKAAADGIITDAMVAPALARQEALSRRAAAARAERPPLSMLRCREHLAFAAEAAPACLAWAYGGNSFKVQPGDVVGYLEPLTAPAEWKGAAFVKELSALGLRVEPFSPGRGMKLLAGIFSGPRAYSGSINLGAEARAELGQAVLGAAGSALAAFGSPFVLRGLEPRPGAALCAFSALDEFQRCAARALAGRCEITGKLPVGI